jgi:histidyl-tRNA synthetase
MQEKIKPRLMKGIRDFLPGDMIKRNYVIKTIVKVFKSHGFLPLETPAMEMWDILSGKYGEEGEQLIYRFTDRGDRDLGLRYDLTIPLARVVAMHQNDIIRPFKRYQIQPVWRADKPGKGRFREFYQCDADIVGSKDPLADAEVIQVSYEILKALGFKKFKIKINSRKILRGIVEASGCDVSKEADVCRSIDKLDKIGFDGVEKELLERGIPVESKDKILDVIKVKGIYREVLSQAEKTLGNSNVAKEGIGEMSVLMSYLGSMGLADENVEFDLSLARGLDYYTGPIFETVVEEPKIGSVSGGGRYDNLIGQFLGQGIPATGNSVGLERIITVMDELNMYPESLGCGIDILICRVAGESLDYSLKLAGTLREAGHSTEIYMGNKDLRGQLGYASEKGIRLAMIAGGDEVKEGQVTIKDMKKQEQQRISGAEILKWLAENEN